MIEVTKILICAKKMLKDVESTKCKSYGNPSYTFTDDVERMTIDNRRNCIPFTTALSLRVETVANLFSRITNPNSVTLEPSFNDSRIYGVKSFILPHVGLTYVIVSGNIKAMLIQRDAT